MQHLTELHNTIQSILGELVDNAAISKQELTLEISPVDLLQACMLLRDHPQLQFEMLMDVSGVDYLLYGIDEWSTDEATATGFSRGVQKHDIPEDKWNKPRFAVVYHLLSIEHNTRLRLRVFAEGEPSKVPSVVNIWNSANWYEREVFDLFGIHFENHPDLRRILTDYGFSGHPFRKDFPLSGQVEVRFDAKLGRVVYEPVQIEPRTLVPKVIRHDSRYEGHEKTEGK